MREYAEKEAAAVRGVEGRNGESVVDSAAELKIAACVRAIASRRAYQHLRIATSADRRYMCVLHR